MEDIFKYENSSKLYQFLIDDFGLLKIDDNYEPETFGNFYITLAANDFLLSYVNDRFFLNIDIASILEPNRGFSLSFVKNFLYNPANINLDDGLDNLTRITELNLFLKKDFVKIGQLFSSQNYFSTKKQIDDLLREQFNKRINHQKLL